MMRMCKIKHQLLPPNDDRQGHNMRRSSVKDIQDQSSPLFRNVSEGRMRIRLSKGFEVVTASLEPPLDFYVRVILGIDHCSEEEKSR